MRRGLSKSPCLLARSRGGLMLYNWAVEHPSAVAGVAGSYPGCNLDSYPLEQNSGELAQRYQQWGGVMTRNVIKGQGHSMWPGWFQNQELVDFAIARALKGKPDAGGSK